MQTDLGPILAGNWPATLHAATHMVREAEEQSLRVFNTPEGINRRLEATTALSQIGQARGALAALRQLFPESPDLEELWRRLNHCPVLMVAGEMAGQPVRQLRLVK